MRAFITTSLALLAIQHHFTGTVRVALSLSVLAVYCVHEWRIGEMD